MSTLRRIVESVGEGDVKSVKELIQKALSDGLQPATLLDDGLVAGMETTATLFGRNEIFVPDVMLAARAMRAGMELLEPLLVGSGVKPIGKVALGTVKGDVHNIGKDLVGIMLKGAGFEVIDLGVDVEPEKFVNVVKEREVELAGMSGLLTTALPMMKTTIEAFDTAGLRKGVKIIVGGAVVTRDYADKIGADGYAANAAAAITEAKELLKKSKGDAK